MKEISQKILIILIVVLVIVSAIEISLYLSGVGQVPTVKEFSTSGKVNVYVLPKPSTSQGKVVLEVVNQTKE
ncbi:MAG: hypothetical protein QW818_03710 [Candidatus Aenigmatarchaeota archaeon]